MRPRDIRFACAELVWVVVGYCQPRAAPTRRSAISGLGEAKSRQHPNLLKTTCISLSLHLRVVTFTKLLTIPAKLESTLPKWPTRIDLKVPTKSDLLCLPPPPANRRMAPPKRVDYSRLPKRHSLNLDRLLACSTHMAPSALVFPR